MITTYSLAVARRQRAPGEPDSVPAGRILGDRGVTASEATGGRAHWDEVYSRKALDQVSWFEPVPARSLQWIADTGIAPGAAVIDVGGGVSTLVDEALPRATHPGSHVLISTFGPEGPMRCSGLETCRYDAGQLAGEVGAGFTLVRSAVVVHTTPGGARQQFLHTHFTRD
jgi:hypothetical protein